MTEQRPDREPTLHPDAGAPPGTPRWVKVSAAVVGVLILVFLALQLAGLGGEHGPGRHGSSGPAPAPGATSAVAALR